MQSINLAELTEGLRNFTISGREDTPVSGIQYESDQVRAGDLFVCIKGNNFDGHDFAREAASQGAGCLVVNSLISGIQIPQLIVEDSRKAMGMIAANFFGNPSGNLKMAGITGTNGKTTTSFMTASIIKAAEGTAGTIGTLGIFVGDEKTYEGRTTPESLDIQRALHDMLSNDIRSCVSEISSHAIDQGRHLGCQFDSLAFTNLTQDHLDYHMTMEAYKAAKARLFNDPEVHKDGAAVIYNVDDECWRDIVGGSACNRIAYGLTDGADIQGMVIKEDLKGSIIKLVNKVSNSNFEIKINLPGTFNIYNALAAASIAFSLGYSEEDIAKGLANLTNVPGRTETLNCQDGFNVVIDYAHTPDGLSKILSSLKNCTEGKIITVFGCGGDRDKQKRPLMGQVVDELSDVVIVTSDNPRSEDPQEIADQTVAGIRRDCQIVLDRREAIEIAISGAEKGDCVLVAGKGHEAYQEINNNKIYFNDREEVMKILGLV